MLSAFQQLVPSMFHRRLLLLGGVVIVTMLLLAAQAARLTTGAQHTERRRVVEKALEVPELTPTVRGRIFDRKGRVLAEDKPGWDIEVDYDVLSGEWAFGQAVDTARRELGRTKWSELDPAQRHAVAEQFIEPFRLQVDEMKLTLAGLADLPPDTLDNRQRDVVAWVQQLTANATANTRRRRMEALQEDREEVTWADAYTPVREEREAHPMLFDVTGDVVARVEYFIARARQEEEAFAAALKRDGRAAIDNREYQVWLQVKPIRIKQRRYPWETTTLLIDRSTLPGPLRNDEPAEVTVNGVGRHILGQLRRIHNGDELWHEKPFRTQDEDGNVVNDLGGYRPNDPIGRFGIERSMESVLRGVRGRRVLHLDTGQEQVDLPKPGGDVHLSLDIQLQARVQALMSHDPKIGLMLSQPWHGVNRAVDPEKNPAPLKPGDPINGAAIVIDIDNGEVLAAVSVPGMSLDDLSDRSVEFFNDHENQPYIFRPVGYRYEPGSTNKPLMLAAGITDGVIGPDQPIDCSRGYLWERYPTRYRDWIYKSYGRNFGRIDGIDAIKVSSNVFFGHLAQYFGRQKGFNRVVYWFHELGFGRKAGCGLYEEVAGFLPGPDHEVTEEEAAYMMIGEGAMGVTPMQVAGAHATVARGGLYIPPTFVQDRSRPGPPRETMARQLHLSPAARDRALRGMSESANASDGTTNHITFPDGHREDIFNCPGVKVFAKSGTAEPPPLRGPIEDEQGRIVFRGPIIRNGNHAWVVVLVQPEGEPRPTHVIAVVSEYAGSGGKASGPIANQIIRAMAAERYLGETAYRAVRGLEPEGDDS